MTDVTAVDAAEPELSAADEQLLKELTERARAGGLKLTGEGGLLGKLTKMIVEGALEGEMDDHLGYGRHAPEGRNSGNSRNGHRAKTVLTEAGPVEISVPRDWDSSFEPKIVANRQRRLTGVEELAITTIALIAAGIGVSVVWLRSVVRRLDLGFRFGPPVAVQSSLALPQPFRFPANTAR